MTPGQRWVLACLPQLPPPGASVANEQWNQYGLALTDTCRVISAYVDEELSRLRLIGVPLEQRVVTGVSRNDIDKLPSNHPQCTPRWQLRTARRLAERSRDTNVMAELIDPSDPEQQPPPPPQATVAPPLSTLHVEEVTFSVFDLVDTDPLVLPLIRCLDSQCDDARNDLDALDLALARLHMYYIDSVTENPRWNELWTYEGLVIDEETRRPQPGTSLSSSSPMTFQTMVFLELMRLRVLRQCYCEFASVVPAMDLASVLDRSSAAFPRACIQQLAFDAMSAVPIAQYTQQELEQAFTYLMFKFHTAAWNTHVHHYVHALMDRLATLVAFPHSGDILNMSHLRRAAASAEGLFMVNFDYLYRMQWRYFYAIKNLVGFEVKLLEDHHHHPPPLVESRVSEGEVAGLALALQEWAAKRVATYSANEMLNLNQQLSKVVVEMLMPQGDREWALYKYPTIQQSTTSLLETLHRGAFKARNDQIMALPKDQTLMGTYTRTAEFGQDLHPFRYMHDYFHLFLFDRHLTDVSTMVSFQFMQRYVVLPERAHLLDKLMVSTGEPYIQRWMGRFYLCINGRTFTRTTSVHTILAQWLLLVKARHPTLWAEVLVAGKSILPHAMYYRDDLVQAAHRHHHAQASEREEEREASAEPQSKRARTAAAQPKNSPQTPSRGHAPVIIF